MASTTSASRCAMKLHSTATNRSITRTSGPHRKQASHNLMTSFEEIRASYRPERITTLFVGESAPYGGTFFYNQDSGLFREIRKAFLGGALFLETFRQSRFYLDDLVLEPVNHLENANRRSICRNAVSS